MTGEQKGGTVVKIYNKKGWVLGMGEILLGIVGVCIYVQTGFQTFDWKAGDSSLFVWRKRYCEKLFQGSVQRGPDYTAG